MTAFANVPITKKWPAKQGPSTKDKVTTDYQMDIHSAT
jgi:hypothetical protein